MNETKTHLGKCPFCSATYAVGDAHRATFRRCRICHGPLSVGELYTEGKLTFIALLPELDGESFTADGYTVTRGVLTTAEGIGDTAVIPAGVIAIGKSAFADNKTLRRVVIPEGVLYIGERAFCGCEGLREVSLPSTLLTLGDAAFAYCSRLVSLTLPQGLRCLGGSAFHFCKNLTVLDMPMDMTYVGGAPYRFCKRLRRAVIPNCVCNPYVWYMGYDWFSEMDALEEIVLGENVASCERMPSLRIRRLVFMKPEGWYTRYRWNDEPTPVDPKRLSDPKAAALYYAKLRREGLSLFRPDGGEDPHILEPDAQ